MEDMKIRFCIFLLILSVFPSFSQDRLVPVDPDEHYEEHIKYCQKVDRLLMGTKEYSYAFQIRPSFTPEYCLLYAPAKKELVFRIASRNIWYSKGRIGVKKYHCPITSDISDKLDSLFSSAVFSSSPDAKVFGLDGTTYEIRTNGGKDIAECWSPDDDGSNCDRLVRILEEMCDIVKNKDVNRIEGLVPEIEALTRNFNRLKEEYSYLEKVKEVSSYLESLVKEGGAHKGAGIRLSDVDAIPVLLSYAFDIREIKSPPTNPLSSYLPSSCSVGVYALWLIEGIRRDALPLAPQLGSIEYGNEHYSSFQLSTAKAYRSWWNSGPIESILSVNPLDNTGLHWY